MDELLADAGAFFEAYLWESRHGRAARRVLAGERLEEDALRAFGVGYAPIGPYVLINHLHGLGYPTEELVAAGLVTRSARGGIHAHFRSRLMFPVRNLEGRVLGFAGLGTHLGPSWALWTTSPETASYRRSEAVFAIDKAAEEIAATGTALVRSDCIEVVRSHQEGTTNAVTVHTHSLTREQRDALAAGIRGGVDRLKLELPPGIAVDEGEAAAGRASPRPAQGALEGSAAGAEPMERPSRFLLKRLAIVTATALVAINVWTGAPLLAVWVGSQVQQKSLVSLRGVVSVIVVLAVLAFLLGWALAWLSAKYDELTGRPAMAGQTSPWHRMTRGDRVQDIRSRYGISAPEMIVVACVVAGVLVFEVWFFFFAGSSIG